MQNNPTHNSVNPVSNSMDDDLDLDKDIEIALKSQTAKCSVCLDKLALPIELPCDHTMCFLCIKGIIAQTGTNECPICKLAFVDDDLMHKLDKDDIDEYAPSWQYSRTDKTNWWLFDPKTTSIIEKLYDDFTSDPDYEMYDHPVKIGTTNYYYDFNSWLQISETNKTRKIQRVNSTDANKLRGIAGLKFN